MAVFSICKHHTAFSIQQNMPWQSSEYILDSKYATVLKIQDFTGLLIRHNKAEYVWIVDNRQGSEYVSYNA